MVEHGKALVTHKSIASVGDVEVEGEEVFQASPAELHLVRLTIGILGESITSVQQKGRRHVVCKAARYVRKAPKQVTGVGDQLVHRFGRKFTQLRAALTQTSNDDSVVKAYTVGCSW